MADAAALGDAVPLADHEPAWALLAAAAAAAAAGVPAAAAAMPLAGLWARVSNADGVTDVLARTATSYATTGLTGNQGLLHHASIQLLRMGGMDDQYGKDHYGMVLASGSVAERLCVRLLNKCESLDPIFATIPPLTEAGAAQLAG